MSESLALKSPSPVSATDRIATYDVLRGVAVCGILLMNITGLGLPFPAYNNPTVSGGAEGWNLAAWVTTNVFFEGTMRALFSLLFGAGVILFTTRLELKKNPKTSVADIYYRRNLWLILFGVIHGYLLLWYGDILYAYGMVALFLFPMRNMKARWLLLLGLLALAIVVPKQLMENASIISARQRYEEASAKHEESGEVSTGFVMAKARWLGVQNKLQPSQESIQKKIDWRRQSSYIDVVKGLAPVNADVQSAYFYHWGFWDVIGMMFLGMALQKWNVLSGRRSALLYAAMMMVGYTIGLSINIFETQAIVNSGFELTAMLNATWTYDLGRLSMACGHLGLVLLICRMDWVPLARNAIAAVGRMALTNYIMHTVICMFLFNGFGLGWFGELQRYQLYFIVFSIWAFQIGFSQVWLHYFKFGPLEWLWRSLTYWQLQPMRISKASPAPIAVDAG